MTATRSDIGGATVDELRHLLRHRRVGAALLAGEGLEIGALHYPLVIPGDAVVQYLDVHDSATLRARFPELAAETMIEPHWIGDVVRATLPAITGRQFDFIVMNHVLEHVANPIRALVNVWAGVRDGGQLVLSVPDKHYTFDRERPVTSYEHLLAEFFQGVTEIDPSHYVDLLERVQPDVFGDRERFMAALNDAIARREHAHVWDSDAFRTFLARSGELLGMNWRCVYESSAVANRFEYFAVLRKPAVNGVAPPQMNSDEHRWAGARDGTSRTSGTNGEDRCLRLLAALYCARTDLQSAFPLTEPRLATNLLRWATTAGAGADSDAVTLDAFQDQCRRLIARLPGHEVEIEEALRASL